MRMPQTIVGSCRVYPADVMVWSNFRRRAASTVKVEDLHSTRESSDRRVPAGARDAHGIFEDAERMRDRRRWLSIKNQGMYLRLRRGQFVLTRKRARGGIMQSVPAEDRDDRVFRDLAVLARYGLMKVRYMQIRAHLVVKWPSMAHSGIVDVRNARWPIGCRPSVYRVGYLLLVQT